MVQYNISHYGKTAFFLLRYRPYAYLIHMIQSYIPKALFSHFKSSSHLFFLLCQVEILMIRLINSSPSLSAGLVMEMGNQTAPIFEICGTILWKCSFIMAQHALN